jgi:general secretion pathway protein A
VSLMVMMPGAADAGSVLLRYARQLGVEEPKEDRSELLAQIYEQLAIVREGGHHAVLIIDDAHVLSADSLSELGGLLNLEYEDRRLVSMLFVGLPELDTLLGKEASLLQRVDVRVRLEPLDLENTSAYVAHRLQVVGGTTDVLPQSTLETLFKWSRGRPRLINTLCDNAIFEAYLAGRKRVEPADVEHAAADLGISMNPGETYTPVVASRPPMALPDSLAPSPPVDNDPLSIDPVDGAEATVMFSPSSTPMFTEGLAEVTAPSADSVFEPLASGSILDAVDDDGLTGLLEESVPLSQQLGRIADEDPFEVSGSIDLDVGVATALAEEESAEVAEIVEPLPLFEADSAGPQVSAEATQIVFTDEAAEVDEGDDELDGLFAELIDE